MAASVSQNGRFRAVFLSVIMVLMTQVGYTDNMDFSIGLNQDTESKDTGGSTPALTPSVEGADLMVGDLMDEITFQYDASAASGSGSNSNSGTYNGNGTAWMVKDINTGTSNNGGSMSAMYLEQDAVMGNEMYFFATDSTNGYELWKSDGTESGTVMVKDINNGSGSSMPSSSSITGVNSNLHLKAMNNTNTLFFVANDGIHGEELWKTDGTASGTVMVKDINSANGNSGHSDIGEFTQMGSTLYFRADDGTNGQELWKTDGTSSGTVMVKDINPGNAGVVDCNCLRAITVVGNTLYFTADDGTHGEELWKSDGTTSGTVMVKNINTDALGAEDSSIQRISVAGNYIYFQATCGSNDCPGSSGSALFRSDGTAAGTVVIKANDFIWTRPTITIGNTLFFVGGSNWNATIWKSNGTSSGTTMAVDVLPQTNTLYTLGDGNGVRRCDRNVGNSFYFMARDHGAGGGLDTRYLWKTDGTASGTVQVKDVNNANVTGGWSTCGIIGDTLFFVKQETRQLWKTNGTSSGTKMIIDMDSLSPSGYGSLSWNFASINNKLYFGAGDGTNGIELWALDPANITGIGSGSGSGSSSSSAFAYANDKVSGGTHQTCAILDNGDLKCWGRDNNGQLGDGGSNTDLNAPSSTAIDLGTGRTAVAVSSGDDFTCAILDNGDLKCWGRDQYGQLGDGGGNTNTNAPSSTAIDLGTGRTAISIAAGYDHACAILDNGDLKCWGRNNYGQLGDGTGGDFTEDNNRLTPTPTASLGTGRTAVAVSAGFGHTCAILDNGEAKCWGRDQYGQLGDGGSAWTSSNPTDTNAPSSTAIDLGTGRTAITVSAGHGHTCAILDNGDLKCWGNDGDGQLGDGGPAWTSSNPTSTNTPSSTAIDLGTGRTAVAVSAGRTYHSCAILDNGEAKCWGRDQYGQLGEDPNQNEGNLDPDTIPIDLGTGRTAVAMSAGGPHTCAILDNGDMKCWGNDLFGQLGDGGTNTHQGEPVLVSGSNTWDSSTTASSGSSGGMSNVTGANCTVSPALPTGLSIDSSTCTISGTPSVATSNTTYTVTANISGTTYQGTVWLATMTFGTITSPVMGAELDLGEAMTPITLNYTSQAGNATVYNGNGTAWMVKDIFPGQVASYQGSSPTLITEVGDTLYFHASNGSPYGRELWKSDGTESGTVMVKDITPGTQQSGAAKNTNMNYFTAVGDTLYFAADDQIHGTELWKSDGTEAGTVMVKDLQPGTYGSGTPYSGGANYITAIGDTVYFSGNDGVNGFGLYKSDGTANGTVFVFSIGSISEMVAVGDTLYFNGKEYVANSVFGLYKSDGTANGTVLVKDINPNTNQGSQEVSRLTPVGDKLYFSGDDGTHGKELWVSDGTANGTFMVKDIANEGGNIHHSSNPFGGNGPTPKPVVVGNNFYFVASVNSSIGNELWKSDGTEAGTVLVVDLCADWHANWLYSAFGDTIFFPKVCPSTNQAPGDGEIWRSDGTASGTVLATNSVLAQYNYDDHAFTPMGNILYFSGKSGTDDYELWAYDPTNVTLNTPPPVSWETYPALPAGMSISNGVISGTPSVYAVNQTYTIYANQSGETTTFDMYFSVDTNNPHTVVENQPIDAIGFQDPFQNRTTNWTVSPALPADLVMDPNTGEITGSVNGVLANTTYTVTATHGDGATETFTFSLQSLADFDGDGLPNELPSDYDAAQQPTPGLVADTDDDADGLEDVVETDTRLYINTSSTGTDPLDPDTDDDGICDGPNAVPPICIAGPDSTPNGDNGPPIWIGLFNKEGAVLGPYKSLPGGTYEIMPDLPQSLTMDPNTGVISGTPTQTLENTTFTVWVNRSDGASLSWNFSIEILADSDGDGFPDELPDDYNSSNPTAPGLVEDLDDDNDGVSDSEEETDGLDSTNPDTDGDGVCDGSIAVDPVCVAGPDAFPLDPSADTDTDGDGKPDSITGNSTSVPPLEEDMDDDGDGFSDELEIISGSDPLDANDVPADLDGDGDGLNNTVETDTGIYNSTIDTGTDPLNPDTDGDGICDGPLSVAGICDAGPDAFPLDPSADTDTDGDGMPDTLTGASTSNPPLVEDDDDDNDGFSDELENNCGSDPLDANDSPADLDGDNICDMMDSDIDGDGLNNTVETNTGIYNSTTDTGTDPLNPDTDGDGICDGPSAPANGGCEAGPDAFPFDPSASKDTDGDGMPDTLTGASTSNPQLVEDEDDDNDGVNDVKEIDCGTDPLDNQSIPALNSEGNCMDATSSGEVDDGGFSYMWCVPCLLILLLLLLIPMLSGRDRVLGMLLVGPEPENTTSEPEFIGGAGTRDDPFILAPAEGVKPGESVSSTEVITIDKMSRINVDMMDFNEEINGDRFSMYETNIDEIGTRIIEVGDDGEITINMLFDDGVDEPTYEGGEFTGLLKLGKASVYLSWTVTIDPDKKKLKEIEKQRKAEEEDAALLAEETEAKKKAEEEAAALLAEEEEEEAKKKAEEEAAAAEAKAAAAEKKAKEEADAEAKKVKVAEEKAAKKKAEEEAKAAAAAKPASKEEKKKAELERVKERSKSIDFKVLGTAKASDKDDLQVIKGIGPFIEEKLNALGIYTYLQISKMTSKLEDTVNEAIEFFPGRVKRDQWVAQAKILLGEDVKIDEKALKKAEELARVAAKAEKIDFGTIGVASVTDKDNLQELKGIGPFIEEKLNALGIFKFEQIAKMTSKIEDEVNIAIEFFPGRVKRDEWVKQAKERTK